MNPGGLIAVPDALDATIAGSIVYWRLSGDVDRLALGEQWVARKLEDIADLPPMTTPLTAMRRTLKDTCTPNQLVRPLRGEHDGFVVVTETYGEDGKPVYTHGLEAVIRNDLWQFVNDDGSKGNLLVLYIQHLRTLAQGDMGSWLVTLTSKVLAVRLRDTGGVYFVPRTYLPLWREFSAAITAATKCSLFEIPSMRSEEAMTSVVDALTNEATEEVTAMSAEIDKFVEKDAISQRSIDTRSGRLHTLEAKLASYEQLLGVKMEALREQVAAVSARLVEASMMVNP